MRAVRIPSDLGERSVWVDLGTDVLANLQEMVGGCVEEVRIPGITAAVGLVNKDGLAQGLPQNRRAQMLLEQPFIAGDCVVIGVDGESWRPCPVHVIEGVLALDVMEMRGL